MTRIFSISFVYDDIQYSALVDVRVDSCYTEYNISLLNTELSQYLPGNKIISSAPGQFAFLNADTGNEMLMNQIIKAISDHIHSFQH